MSLADPSRDWSSAWRGSGRVDRLAFAVILAAVVLTHLPLLRLPFFWDEAGYYIPAARDLFLAGSLIPSSVPSNAHPPLVMAYLGTWWKIAGFSMVVTRIAMLLVAAFALLGVFRLGRLLTNTDVAVSATLCTALYPVFFAQSSMAHIDLAAAGLSLWGLEAYLGGRRRACTLWFTLAALAKETAVLAPLGLLAWELARSPISRRTSDPICLAPPRVRLVSLAAPVAILCGWYAYHYSKTGYLLGNPEFFRYNVQATRHPIRILLALGMRIWQVTGYLHLWVLTAMMAGALTQPPLRDGNVERPRISLSAQMALGLVILAYVSAMALVGGAVLARYMLPVIPLWIILAVSTLRRRIRLWPAWVAVACAAFVAAWFWNPPYGFSLEDNLAYRDYIGLHEDAEHLLESRYPRARVLTAWPASDEISHPYLGYVTQPLRVVQIEDFTAEELFSAARERRRFDVVLLFSTKYEPPRQLLERWSTWNRAKARFFGFHRDLVPSAAAQILGGGIVFREARTGQWIAVIELQPAEEACDLSHRHDMAGVRLHDQPDFPSRHELQSVAGSQRQVDFESYAAVDTGGDDHVLSHQGDDSAGQHITRAQSLRRMGGQ